LFVCFSSKATEYQKFEAGNELSFFQLEYLKVIFFVFFSSKATTAEYQKFEAGNELSFSQLEAYLAKSCPEKSWLKDIVPQARIRKSWFSLGVSLVTKLTFGLV
jgi:hypothetical protein